MTIYPLTESYTQLVNISGFIGLKAWSKQRIKNDSIVISFIWKRILKSVLENSLWLYFIISSISIGYSNEPVHLCDLNNDLWTYSLTSAEGRPLFSSSAVFRVSFSPATFPRQVRCRKKKKQSWRATLKNDSLLTRNERQTAAGIIATF